jgi:Ca-activated chloride channel family protein
MARPSNLRSRQPTALVGALVALAVLVIAGGCLCWAVFQGVQSITGPAAERENQTDQDVVLRVAYSPEKETMFTQLVASFNQGAPKTTDGRTIRVDAIRMEPAAMLQGALNGEFEAMSPDSSIWLHQLDQAYAEQVADANAFLVSQTRYYAISPVVIAMWEDAARELGWPNQPIGWSDLVGYAIDHPDFSWSHPSTASASGLLATLAQFYAAAGVTRGLTPADMERPDTVSRLQEMQRTVSYYGEGEWATAQQVNARGRNYLDAFVVQEQLVVWLNRQGHDIVAIYPREGSLWEDHPLALLETANLTNDQRMAFEALADRLAGPESQKLVLENGYRPADLSLDIKGADSPLTAANGVDPEQPETTLQLAGAQVIEQAQNVWWLIKKKTNVYLVVDTSGSMEGEKLNNVKEALATFVNQIEGSEERVGLVEFWGTVDIRVPLGRLGDNRADLLSTIQALEPGGDTALLDGMMVAYKELARLDDSERINAIVVMTDGQENASRVSLRELTNRLDDSAQSATPIVVFAIAYGRDADYDTLEQIAVPSGGQVREGTVETIRELYQILSTYF